MLKLRMFLLFKKILSDMRKTWCNDFGKLFALLVPQLPAMALAAFFMSIVAAATAGYAYLVGPVLKSLFLARDISSSVSMPNSDISLLTTIGDWLSTASPFLLGGLLIAASVVKGIAYYLQRILVIRAGQQVLYTLRQRLFDGVLRMNPIHREKSLTGNLISRFTVDSHVVEQAVTSGMMALVSNALQALALAILAFSLSLELAVIGMVAFPPIAAVISRLGRLLRKRQGEFYDAWHAVSQVVDESINGLGIVQSFNSEKFARKRFDVVSRRLTRWATSAFSVSAFSSPVNEVLGASALGLTLWYAQMRIEGGSLTPEAFISFFTALFLLYRPVKGFGSAVHALQTGYAAMDKLAPILHPESTFTPRRSVGDGVNMRYVVAGYGGEKPVLNGLSLRAKKGETIAVVGESGSGKTTLLNVLCGYLQPESGEVESSWPVALVPQVPFLFDETIYNNVSLGHPKITRADVERACQMAGVMQFADKLDEGLMSGVGVNGANLSAGERQRVCLARALASGREVLLLDEVTASLDGRNEDNIIESLSGLKDRTVIAVTHRARTAAFAQRTLVLSDGKIVDEGRFTDLIARSEVVKRLFATESQ
jgi:ATP-binding cassette, subfamily B, bacterial MsbA